MSFEFPNNNVVDSMIGDALEGHPTKKDVKDEIDSATKVLSEKIDKKVEKVSGKGLSTNDFTNEYKEKLDNLDSGSGSPVYPDLSGYATKEEVNSVKGSLTDEVSAVKDSLTDKADVDKVWLRGGDVTGETNYAKSIEVNEIKALDDESCIKFNSPIITSEIEDENGTTQNLTIEHNEISAHFTEEENGLINWGTIVLNGSVELWNGGLYSYEHPIMASSFDSYMYHVQSGGALVFNGYDEFLFPFEVTLDALGVENLLSNSWYVQENLRGHITHDIGYDDLWGNYGGIVTITPTDEYGGYSDFCFYSNGGLSMSGGLRATDLSCSGYVSCYDLQASLGVYANSYIEKSWSEEFDDSYYGGFSVTDTNDQDITSKLIAGKLRIEKYYYDGESDGYYDYVDMGIDIENGLSLSLSHGKRKLTFSFSDFATLRTMIDEYNASKGA